MGRPGRRNGRTCPDRDLGHLPARVELFDRGAVTGSGFAPRGAFRRLYRVKQWMYRGDRPGPLARVLNRLDARQFSAGWLSPAQAMVLEVQGRRTGRPVTLPVSLPDLDGRRYLVSMLGNEANWVLNVRAAGGRAVLIRRGRQHVRLVEVPVGERAPILRRYLQIAPGARPHLPVDRRAPVQEFERIADRYPVFEVLEVPAVTGS